MSIFKSHNDTDTDERPTDRDTDTRHSDVAPDDRVAEGGYGTTEADSDTRDDDRSRAETRDPAAAAPAGERGNGSVGSADAGTTGSAGTDAGSTGADTSAERAATDAGHGEPERLMPRDRADAYSSRWDSVKSGFVDEPRDAVGKADSLVGELLDELHQIFADQRRQLEDGLDADTTSTEDLRIALRRYRSFFDRLVSF